MECITDTSFNRTLLLKCTAPFVVIALLWLKPAAYLMLKRPGKADEAQQKAAELSLLLLEVVCPSVTTTIVQMFVCDRFDGGDGQELLYLRADLTLECDASSARRAYLGFAVAMIFVYPLGVPCFLMSFLYPNRKNIAAVLSVLKEEEQEHQEHQRTGRALQRKESGLKELKNHRRPSIANLSMKTMWLLPKIKKLNPDRWFMGVVFLITRLCQTSLIAPFSQTLQAIVAGCVAIVAACVQRELHPYRNRSECVAVIVCVFMSSSLAIF